MMTDQELSRFLEREQHELAALIRQAGPPKSLAWRWARTFFRNGNFTGFKPSETPSQPELLGWQLACRGCSFPPIEMLQAHLDRVADRWWAQRAAG
jgi:hypothetical protein